MGSYYPFGLKHKGYNSNITSTNIGQNKKYQNQELEEELDKNTYAFEWRDYDPAIARFSKLDRFSEKYFSKSPYGFTANNPILFNEIKGDSLDVSNALRDDPHLLKVIVKDLSSKTGLTFKLEKGKLIYEKDSNGNAVVSKDGDGNAIGSATARNLITNALDHTTTVELGFEKVKGGTGESFTDINGQEFIALDPKSIQSAIDGTSKGLDKTTFGFAMNLMHEIDHTSIGVSKTGHGAESTTFGLTGTVVDRMNVIRSELGASYGQRSSYAQWVNSSGSYLPFSGASNNFLQSNNPTPGILMFMSNNQSLKHIYKTIKTN